MHGIIYVVLFATACLLLLVIYDKRQSFINFLKKKKNNLKEKLKAKPKVSAPPADVSHKHDSDKDIKPENISYGPFSMPKESKDDFYEPTKDDFFGAGTIFSPIWEDDDSDDEFDIDQMLQEIEDEKREEVERKYASDSFEPEELPDFDKMSISELNRILEDDMTTSASFGTLSANDNLSGEELGEYIKTLPRAIKVLIATDIFKRKF